MLVYDKQTPTDFLGCEITGDLHSAGTLSAYDQATYPAQIYTPILESHSISDDDSVHYVSSNGYAGSPFELARSPSLDIPSKPAPEVTSFTPTSGVEGVKLSVYIQSPFDLLNPGDWAFTLVFHSSNNQCAITPLGIQKEYFQYALEVNTPSFASTECCSFDVPLKLVMEDRDGPTTHIAEVGVFMYERVSGKSSPVVRKRRMSAGSDAISESTNSSSVKHLRVNDSMTHSPGSESMPVSPYSPYLATASSGPCFPVQYHRVPSPCLPAGQPDGYHNLVHPKIKAPSPLASTWSPTFTEASTTSHGNGLHVAPVSQGPDMQVAAKTPTPTLIRTSTIQQSLLCSSQTHAFNPYAMYPSKAVLKLNGDLDSMIDNWTKDEQETQRRLVQFTRRQIGSTIHADFSPVAPADRAPNSICISCISWAGKKECYVTSVDTIYLLESLVGVRFTVEEKNRIRRNLEGFRPLTVSKAKAESEDFFKVIMGFPNPKPRNIEKDVKVFPWKILSHALKKIIGKYSASYSSTAGAIHQPLGSNYPENGIADGSFDGHTSSPRSMSGSASPCPPGLSPNLHPQVFATNSSQLHLAPPARAALPRTDYAPAAVHPPYAVQAHHPRFHPAPPTALERHPSFDFNAYVNNSPVSAVPPTQELGYSYNGSLVGRETLAAPLYNTAPSAGQP